MSSQSIPFRFMSEEHRARTRAKQVALSAGRARASLEPVAPVRVKRERQQEESAGQEEDELEDDEPIGHPSRPKRRKTAPK